MAKAGNGEVEFGEQLVVIRQNVDKCNGAIEAINALNMDLSGQRTIEAIQVTQSLVRPNRTNPWTRQTIVVDGQLLIKTVPQLISLQWQ